MDASIPAGADKLLDLIGDTEAPKGYDTIYGNNQGKLDKPITQMRLIEVINAQAGWTKAYGSSAAGRYQFMKATLQGLQDEVKLSGVEYFTPNLQDRLAMQLLRRRGWDKFVAGQLSATTFGRNLAMEWASFPVLADTANSKGKALKRGQSFYAGDGMNKALIAPEKVEAALNEALAAHGTPVSASPAVQPPPSANAAPEPTVSTPVPIVQTGVTPLAAPQHSSVITDLIAKVASVAAQTVASVVPGANPIGAIISGTIAAVTHPDVQAAATAADDAVKSMPEGKPALSSVTIWGALGVVASSLFAGWNLWAGGDRNVGDYWPLGTAIVGAGTAIYGRITAKKAIGSTT